MAQIEYTDANGNTATYEAGDGEKIGEKLQVESVSAINGTEVTVTLANVPADLPAGSEFTVSDSNDAVYAVTNIAATATEGQYKLTLGTAVAGVGTLTVAYGDSSADLAFDTTIAGLNLSMSTNDEDATLTADGADNAIVTVTVLRDGVKDESFEGTVKFQSLKGAQFAKETVAFDKGVASVQLTSMSSAVAIQDTIVATIAEAPADESFVGESQRLTMNYVPVDGNQETGDKVFITYAESDSASDIFVKFNKDINFEKVYADWEDDSTIIQISDDGGLSYRNIEDLVQVDGNTVKLVLLESQALNDNKEITIKATNSGVDGTLIDSNYSFNLVDKDAPEALGVSTPDYRTIVTKFTEPVSVTTAEVVGNWVLNGHQLAAEDVAFVKVGRDLDDSKTIDATEVYKTDNDNRNYVTIRLTATGAGYFKEDADGNPKMNLLQAYDMIDYAGLTDTTGQNEATTQEFKFMTPEAPAAPTATVYMDSPEQYRVVFSSDVQTKDGSDLDKDHFEFKYQSKADPTNADDTIKYAESIPTANDATTADSVVVTKVSDNEYLLEMNRDWTEELDTDTNNINYYTPDNNHVQISVKVGTGTDEIVNLNEVAMAADKVESFELNIDDLEPAITTASQSYDTDGTPLKKVEITMNEPVQMVDDTGATLMTAEDTISQYQGTGVPVPTFEFVSEDLKTTIEGKLVASSLTDDDITFEVEPVDTSKLTAGNWTVYVRSISDDIGNTSATEKYDVTIEAAASETGAPQVIWADAHDNVDLDIDGTADSDVVHVQFGTEMDLDVFTSTVYTINGEDLPTGVKVEGEEKYYDSDDDGVIESNGDDLSGTFVSITLPKGFLGTTSDVVNDDISTNALADANQDQPHILNISKNLTSAEGVAIKSPTEIELTYEINDGGDNHGELIHDTNTSVMKITSASTVQTAASYTIGNAALTNASNDVVIDIDADSALDGAYGNSIQVELLDNTDGNTADKIEASFASDILTVNLDPNATNGTITFADLETAIEAAGAFTVTVNAADAASDVVVGDAFAATNFIGGKDVVTVDFSEAYAAADVDNADATTDFAISGVTSFTGTSAETDGDTIDITITAADAQVKGADINVVSGQLTDDADGYDASTDAATIQ
ncbi:hypothetical protein [Dethiothermospora halolimnae]|uniref:hypothetical protein n=1 Tax=Dethiothermospora halolimnae TaxID=3114390 RepID=UPI003CCBFC9E